MRAVLRLARCSSSGTTRPVQAALRGTASGRCGGARQVAGPSPSAHGRETDSARPAGSRAANQSAALLARSTSDKVPPQAQEESTRGALTSARPSAPHRRAGVGRRSEPKVGSQVGHGAPAVAHVPARAGGKKCHQSGQKCRKCQAVQQLLRRPRAMSVTFHHWNRLATRSRVPPNLQPMAPAAAGRPPTSSSTR